MMPQKVHETQIIRRGDSKQWQESLVTAARGIESPGDRRSDIVTAQFALQKRPMHQHPEITRAGLQPFKERQLTCGCGRLRKQAFYQHLLLALFDGVVEVTTLDRVSIAEVITRLRDAT